MSDPYQDLLAEVDAALDRLTAEGALLQAEGAAPLAQARARVQVDPPREAAFGDASTNAAMVLAKAAGARPLDLATRLAEGLRGRGPIVDAAAAPPGFVNLRLDPAFWQGRLEGVLRAGGDYGRRDVGRGRAVNVEFCSANPTGPLHVGHGRGTVVGDVLASLLERMGYAVTREYYVNDGGAQIEALARSIHHRYQEVLGRSPGAMPQGLYPLPQLIAPAQAIAARDGAAWLDRPEAEWLDRFGSDGVAAMLAVIKDDLAALGVHHDVFTSERGLIEAGAIEATLADLSARDLVYEGTLPPPKGKPVDDWEPVPQLLFRASAYGDEIDRPLRRSVGAWTYFAADTAYHRDKFARGFATMIDIWGADHGGYIKRMQAGVKAATEGRGELEVLLCQLVNLMDSGHPLKMSKRAGRIVTLRDVVDEVGPGAFRFMMLTRKNDASLDFDLAKVREQSRDNPVFYVQYAHARVCSVLRAAGEAGLLPAAGAADDGPALRDWLAGAETALLADPDEIALVKLLCSYPRVLFAAAEHREPHRIAYFLYDLASALHALWTKGRERPELRFLVAERPDLTRARLAMVVAVQTVIAAGLGVMRVEPLREMH